MYVAKQVIVGCSALALSASAAIAQDFSLVEDFSLICLQTLPNVEMAEQMAESLGYVELPLGLSPEFDRLMTNPPNWKVFGMSLPGNDLVIFKVAETQLDSSQSEVLESTSAALCGLESTFDDPDVFAAGLSQLLMVDQPTADFVNSGRRERSWNASVDYINSTIVLKEFAGPSGPAFQVGLVTPLQER